MSTFTSIDLSKLPPPDLVEELSYETILAATRNELQMIAPELDVDSLLESDPISKLLQVMAYRELHLRQRINESARGVMLATATGSNLDNLAALVNVQRHLLNHEAVAAGEQPEYEDDDRLRTRTQLAFEGFSTAGSEGAYLFHASSASEDVKDVAVYSERPGEVEICVLSREGSGTASGELIRLVEDAVNADEIRPLTDWVKVKSAEIVPYQVDASLVLLPGVGGEEVRKAAKEAVLAFMESHHRLGADITRAGLISALYQNGVQNVILHEPVSDVLIARDQVAVGTIREDIKWTQQATSMPTVMPSGIQFDKTTGTVTVLRVVPEEKEMDISHYAVYWGGNNTRKLPLSAKAYQFDDQHTVTLDHDNAEKLWMTNLDGSMVFLQDRDYQQTGKTITAISEALKNLQTDVRITYELPPLVVFSKDEPLSFNIAGQPTPKEATHLLAFSVNEYGEMLYGVSVEI
ncbi:baseplate assembly protein [Gynuella sp.]|uniref:baseplate assembly protein n=1 Tax=Gynuella sp. TaxID=2969146 RepID=UPI003D09DE00